MFRRRFEADDDIPLWDEELMILGARATFLKNEGFDGASAEADFRTAEYEMFAPEQECIQFGARPSHPIAPMRHQHPVHIEPVPYHSDRHFTYSPSTQFHSHTHVESGTGGGTGPTPPPRTWNTGATAPTDPENWLGWWPPSQPDGTHPRYIWDGAWAEDS
jgi:hypothetical protein